jgi:hypothetical protein
MSVAHKQDWYCSCNDFSEEHSASILLVEEGSLEIYVHYYQTTQHYIPEDGDLHCHHQINN